MSSAWLDSGGGWEPGFLLASTGERVLYVDQYSDVRLTVAGDSGDVRKIPGEGQEPDDEDHGTRGVMLGSVREAYDDPGAFLCPWGEDDGWALFAKVDEGPGRDGVGQGPTEAAALADAYRQRPTEEKS